MFIFFVQAEDGIRDLVRSRGLGDVYKRQVFDKFADVGKGWIVEDAFGEDDAEFSAGYEEDQTCLLYTSDAADERSSVDLGGRRIIKKKTNTQPRHRVLHDTTTDKNSRIRQIATETK